MQSKLEELARKEEELRRINEALNIKKDKILAEEPSSKRLDKAPITDRDEEEDKFSDDNSDDQFKGQNLAKGKFAAAAAAFEEDEDDYGDGNFENDAPTGKSSKMKAAAAMYGDESGAAPESSSFKGKYQMRMDDEEDQDDDIAAAVAAGKRAAAGASSHAADDELPSGMYEELKRKYEGVLSESREQEKTINFQKAKIAALQTELEESLRLQAEQKTQLDLQDKESGKAQEVDKKLSDKLNTLNLQVSKLKNQVAQQNEKIKDYERAIAESNKDMDAVEREKRRQQQEQGNKDAKLNRALEEIEKLKLALREAKINESGRSENVRRDQDRLVEDNRKLERQRNELLQAFKKQMKLIDVLKRQKMHIESAKLLAFTEDEFVRTLELGDKL